MAKSTHPIAYQYEIDRAIVVIERVHLNTAYARNGNVGNPTEYFHWNWSVEMAPRSIEPPPYGIQGNASTRADAYEHARAAVLGIPYRNHRYAIHCINVRPWTVVKAEMQTNYRGSVEAVA